MTAVELFDHMVAVIDKALADQNIYAVPEAADAAGMDGGEVSRGLSQRWEYSLRDGGHEVKVMCRWYDPSQAFSIQPDVHIMTVEIIGPGVQRSHTRRFDR